MAKLGITGQSKEEDVDMGEGGKAATPSTAPAADVFIQKTQQHQHTQQLYQELLASLGEDHLSVISLKAGLD
eukprot:5977937-Karenia_brevis.AAC.1